MRFIQWVKENRSLFAAAVFAAFDLVCLAVAVAFLAARVPVRTFLGADAFSDFLETLAYASVGNPYAEESAVRTNYPPLSILMLLPFTWMAKDTIGLYLDGKISFTSGYLYRYPDFLAAYFVYHALSLALFCFAAYKLVPKGYGVRFRLGCTAAAALCGPMPYCFGRGNILLPAVTFSLLFFAFFRSGSRAMRELANLFLALAVGIKLYPALFALFFVKDRRWLDLVKAAAYSVVFVAAPLFFFDGGFFENFRLFLTRIFGFNALEDRYFHKTNVSVDFLFAAVAEGAEALFGADIRGAMNAVSTVFHILLLAFAGGVSLFAGKNKADAPFALFVCCVYIYFTRISYAYNLLIFVIAAVYLYDGRAEFSSAEKIFFLAALFIVFVPALYLIKFSVAQFVAVAALFAYSSVLMVRAVLKNIRSEKENAEE